MPVRVAEKPAKCWKHARWRLRATCSCRSETTGREGSSVIISAFQQWHALRQPIPVGIHDLLEEERLRFVGFEQWMDCSGKTSE